MDSSSLYCACFARLVIGTAESALQTSRPDGCLSIRSSARLLLVLGSAYRSTLEIISRPSHST
ncbi:hypothetical protein RSAG8_09034, partial [Rhizoctonia solani AG-8 WAC10335]